ncbi:hypothetical protein BGZ83_010215 [Gryganskiella cystojenkinii]|nr:hypothetical protein BGZ83_010215 [Gryganskiella cystojenkinii]
MNFTIEATLDSREPFTIDLLGTPSAVMRELTGKIRLVVQKPMQLKQITASFIGQGYVYISLGNSKLTVKSEPMNIDRTDHQLLQTTTLYQPGEYIFPFQLNIPTDIVTTDTSKVRPHNLILEYFLTASAQPAGLLSRKKEWRQKLTIQRVHVEQSRAANSLFSAKRENVIECSMYAPKFLRLGQDSVSLSVHMHAFSRKYRVQKISVQLLQHNWINLELESNAPKCRGKRFIPPSDPKYSKTPVSQGRRAETITHSYNVSPVSDLVVVKNPTPGCSEAWGRESPIEIVLKLEPEQMQPSEVLTWLKIVHVVEITVHFRAGDKERPMIVKTPLVVGRVVDDSYWTDHVLWELGADEFAQMQSEIEQKTQRSWLPEMLPEYGQDVADTTLLDSNTHRVNNARLFRELYPERGELVVPDVTNEQPPVYEREGVILEPQAEKSRRL